MKISLEDLFFRRTRSTGYNACAHARPQATLGKVPMILHTYFHIAMSPNLLTLSRCLKGLKKDEREKLPHTGCNACEHTQATLGKGPMILHTYFHVATFPNLYF